MESHLTHDETLPKLPPSRWRRPFVRASLLLSILSLLVFLGLTTIVLRQMPPLYVDASVALFLKQHTSHKGEHAMELVSALADPGVPLLGVAVALALAFKRRWADLSLWLTGLGGGLLINMTVKDYFDSQRPPWADPLHLGHFWQFPSGHVLGATIGYGLLALLLWRKVDLLLFRVTLLLGLIALLLVIGFSRLYVRDHYLGDVLAGYAAGLSWLALCAGVWAAYRPARGVLQ
ncbi:MAG TPA: phosphatase PAP2 family protein [Roseiflexaceae bacterium]|nr:phosphatase PAP2 family protein [Roseiflexaceae bacterium]